MVENYFSKIVGNGQLAKAFKSYKEIPNSLIFASGVSNSNVTQEDKFLREKNLLLNNLDFLKKHKNRKNIVFVYFSSCVVSTKEYPKNPYYKHKENMENIIRKNSIKYLIVRVPQLFGDLKKHPTLINFIYNSILEEKNMKIYDRAYRYVIEINDVLKIVESLVLEPQKTKEIIDIANPFRYRVIDIIRTLEDMTNKRAKYNIVEEEDGYFLKLGRLNKIIEERKLSINFGEDYLYDKLIEKIGK